MGRWAAVLLLACGALPRAFAAAAYPYATEIFGVVEDVGGADVGFYDVAYVGIRTFESSFFANHRYTSDALHLAVDYVNTRREPKGVLIGGVQKYLRLTTRSTAGADDTFAGQKAQCVALARATVRAGVKIGAAAAQVVFSPASSDLARFTTPVIDAAGLLTLATAVSDTDTYKNNSLIFGGLSAASSRFQVPVELAVRRGARQLVYVSTRTKTINDELVASIAAGVAASKADNVRFGDEDRWYFDDYENAEAFVSALAEVYGKPYAVGKNGVDALISGFAGEDFAQMFYALKSASVDVGTLMMSEAAYDAGTWAYYADLAGFAAGPSDHLYIASTPQWLPELETRDMLTGWTSAEYAQAYEKIFLYSPDYHSATAHTDVALLVIALERSSNGSAASLAAFFRGVAESGEMIPGLLNTTLDANGQQKSNYIAAQLHYADSANHRCSRCLASGSLPGTQRVVGKGLEFPVPPWAQRRCVDEALCLNDGLCNVAGECVCVEVKGVGIKRLDNETCNVVCRHGFYRNGSATCAPAPPGSYQPLPENVGGLETVISCDFFEYQPSAGEGACVPCANNAHVVGWRTAATGADDCVCDAGSYTLTWPLPVGGCRDCPDGATCDGGLVAPFPDRGFWQLADATAHSKVEVYRCDDVFVCDGGNGGTTCARPAETQTRDGSAWAALPGTASAGADTCVDGYSAWVPLGNTAEWCSEGYNPKVPLCSGHLPGFFYFDKFALICPDGDALRGLVTGVSYILLFAAFTFINDVIRAHYPVLDTVLLTYQDIGIIVDLNFEWPASLAPLFIVFRIALFDVDIITPTCSYAAWNGLHVFALMLLLPLSAAARYGGQYVLSTRHKTANERRELGEVLFGNFLSFVVGAQASQIRQCLLVFSCRRIQGNGLVLYNDLSVECGGGTLVALRVVGIAYLAVVIVGATSAVYAHLFRNPHLFADASTLRLFGFLYTPFRSGALFWGAVRLLKQFALVAILVSFKGETVHQAWTAIIVIVIVTILSAVMQPNLSYASNWAEILGAGLTVFTIVCGLSFTIASENGPRSGQVLIVFLAFNVAYFAFALTATMSNGLDIYRRDTALANMTAVRVKGLAQAKAAAFAGDSESGDEPWRVTTAMLLLRGISAPTALLLQKKEPLEAFATFRGAALARFTASNFFLGNATTAVREFCELDIVLRDAVCDESPTGNFSCTHAADFYRRLTVALPYLLEFSLVAEDSERKALAGFVRELEAQDRLRRASRVPPIEKRTVEPIDQSSVLHFALHAPTKHVALLKSFLHRLVSADPRLPRDQATIRRHVAAMDLQHAWRVSSARRRGALPPRCYRIARMSLVAFDTFHAKRLGSVADDACAAARLAPAPALSAPPTFVESGTPGSARLRSATPTELRAGGGRLRQDAWRPPHGGRKRPTANATRSTALTAADHASEFKEQFTEGRLLCSIVYPPYDLKAARAGPRWPRREVVANTM
ncbi:hypothetical protein M885DRAFT_591338 [Pelagophyceae sp. CCMP2097]|nr:hypothetical protein M885DRAFT_591338 [Pelagophyceae sp. CCMP2097]